MLTGDVLTDVCRLVIEDADCYRSRDDLHADVLARIKYLLACSQALEELAEYAGYDREGCLPDYVDTFLGEVQKLKEEVDQLKY